ncbi:hypothetical protein [Flavobacterium crassostreae]|uniref:Uncharacterized protein n=1 Tax=Flavobacterium crassostreae TaxID=1763534 RepID=A0A1B9E7P9_9FLAO|nr:hypothetical protein [Flavobacterium crassostreae]OCB77963.1 hypothetical protein LPBF_03175 [Flavobacterium crassostreae]
MDIKLKIQETPTFKKLIKNTPFLKGILLKNTTTDSIERIIYQIQKFGEEYVVDKNYMDRELHIAKEIIKDLTE